MNLMILAPRCSRDGWNAWCADANGRPTEIAVSATGIFGLEPGWHRDCSLPLRRALVSLGD